MVHIHLSYTGRINPSGATPVLTQDQVWQGLQRKGATLTPAPENHDYLANIFTIRYAQEFVPVIQSCEVLSDEDGVVTREVIFKPGAGPKPKATETVKAYWPSWVDFHQEDGTLIKNVISNGPSLQDDDLHMTYVFEFNYPHIEQGSEEAEKEASKMKGMSKVAVEKSIETIRQMVVDGKIK